MRSRFNKRKIHYKRTSNFLSLGDHPDHDKNELFVIQKCSSYLYRYLSGRFILDDETMEFICWVLGEDKQQIAEYLIKFFNQADKEKMLEALSESGTDNNEYGRVITKALMKIKAPHYHKFKNLVLGLIQKRRLKIKYRGLSDVEKSISKIQKMFKLSENEVSVCTFLFIITSMYPVESFFENHLECNKFAGRKHFKNIIGINQSGFNKIFSGSLANAGLLKIDRYNIELDDDLLLMFQSSPHQIFSTKFYSKVSGSVIPLEYHLDNEKQTNHVLQLLKKKSTIPTHILLYGPPGTGKTSFAYGISKKLKLPTFEIAREENNKSVNRRAAIMACLNMTNAGDGSLIIIDEADNVLNTVSSWFIRGETQDKGWLNHLLEEPGVRMIWISNTIEGTEDSVLRRFAFSMHFKPFNGIQRVTLWDNIVRKNKCRSLFTDADIIELSKKFKVSPGAIDLAFKKARQLRLQTRQDFLKAIEMGLEAHQTLSNYGEKPARRDRIERNYSLDGLNISGDMHSLINQLNMFDNYLRQNSNHAINNLNLLFYGPPGSGKSELARYIADQLGREMICKRLSDILDPYVGVAEKNIRKAFEEAEREEAILIIDEADSLLHPREAAMRSWEINFTNEFLTQMERFKGILICTTNRMKKLDTASIRRFNRKIGFDFLEPAGNIIFYKKLLATLVDYPLQESDAIMLSGISDLTPGDFKIVRDRYAFYPTEDLCHDLLIRSLAEESSIKKIQKGAKAIGF